MITSNLRDYMNGYSCGMYAVIRVETTVTPIDWTDIRSLYLNLSGKSLNYMYSIIIIIYIL